MFQSIYSSVSWQCCESSLVFMSTLIYRNQAWLRSGIFSSFHNFVIIHSIVSNSLNGKMLDVNKNSMLFISTVAFSTIFADKLFIPYLWMKLLVENNKECNTIFSLNYLKSEIKILKGLLNCCFYFINFWRALIMLVNC